MTRLRGAITLVTGASRGAGRGIALELGEAGATVYVTGRSVAGGSTTDGLPGTIDETAAAKANRAPPTRLHYGSTSRPTPRERSTRRRVPACWK